jgi:type I restriction-modification system DNA methylase subunit
MSLAKFICKLCKKDFKQKSDYNKHINKKSPCVSIQEIQNLTQTITINNDNKTNLTTIFKYCLNVLRDNEHLTGDKSLRTLSHLLDLRLLEPQFGNTINIDSYEYNFEHIEPEDRDRHKTNLLSIVRFSNLAKETTNNIPNIMKFLWDDILSVHPKTKNIFIKNKGFDINNASTYKKIIDKLMCFDFNSIENDILGEAYEEVIKDVMIGKTLGQYFTPPKVKQMMVNLIDPQLKADGTIETIFDPAMGTGGFLITCLRTLLIKSKIQNIPLNWDFISDHGLGGREAEADTYQLAVSNMLIASGKMFNVLEKGDSIREPITNKYDIILANPPFGIDGLTYTEIMHPLRNEYMPISSNSAVPLFLQAIIYMLKVNGRCAVVLPEGQELFSKSKALVAVREYLMKTCDLKEVIYLPAGTFTHATVKTCVFYFHKKKEGKDVLETKLKYSKTTQKETERLYVFSKTHQTHKVNFYDYNIENNTKHLLLEVAIEDLAKNNYSLNYAEYLKDETVDEVYEDGVVVKTLGEVCTFLPKSKRQASYGEKQGEYPFYTSSQICSKYCDIYDYEDECLIIGTGGTSNVKYSRKFSCSTDNFIIKFKNGISTKYIYYYLLHNIKILQNGFVGIGIQHISKEYLSGIKIPIPPLDRQQQIVKYLDFIYEKCIKTSTEKIMELNQLNKFCLNNQKVFGENSVKTLGEVCEFKNGTNITKNKLINGEYPVVGGGQSPLGYHNVHNVDENTILISKDGAYAGYVSKYNKKVFVSNHGIYISKLKININKDYIYYLLKLLIQQKLYDLQKGTAQPGINKIDIEKLKIPIPPLDRQKEIVEYCEFNATLIQQLEKEIEYNKKQAQQFITGIVKSQVQTEEQDNTVLTLNNSDNEEIINTGSTFNDLINNSD